MRKRQSRPSLDEVQRFRAPARVNIIGEHTDYNDGLVLPTTTALFTSVTAVPRPDRIIRIESREMRNVQSFDLDDIEPAKNPGWIDYAKGVAAELEAEGIRLQGADLQIESQIPLGGGLSSSASFELAVAPACRQILTRAFTCRNLPTRRNPLCGRQLRHHGSIHGRLLQTWSCHAT